MKTRFYALLTITLFFISFNEINGQGELPNRFSTLKKVKRYNSYFLPIYKFQENDKIASIGAGSGIKEMMYSMESPKVSFYLEDIDSVILKPGYIKIFKYELENIFKKETESNFHVIIGDNVSTKLPDIVFDKVLIENSLHEFDFPNEMLSDIISKLSKDGSLFIFEKVATKPGQRHKGCNRKLYSEAELVELLNKFQCKLEDKYKFMSLIDDSLILKFKKY